MGTNDDRMNIIKVLIISALLILTSVEYVIVTSVFIVIALYIKYMLKTKMGIIAINEINR